MPTPPWSPNGAAVISHGCRSTIGCGRSCLVLILAAQIFSSCFTLAQAALNVSIAIKLIPRFPITGDDVYLLPAGFQENIETCIWYLGDTRKFLEILIFHPQISKLQFKDLYSGREIVYENCTLIIRNVTTKDTNFYALHKLAKGKSELGIVPLVISEENLIGARKGLSPPAAVAMFLGCFAGVMFLVAVFIFPPGTYRERERDLETRRESLSPEEIPRDSLTPDSNMRYEPYPQYQEYPQYPTEEYRQGT